MYVELKELLYKAEDHYLQPGEIEQLRNNLDSLKIRLATYKSIRNQEITVFQAIADQLTTQLEEEDLPEIQKAIIHWASVLRYAAMAMLLNSPEFLERRILEWLNPTIQAHEKIAIENSVYQLLSSGIKNILDEPQWELINPFLQQAQNTLLQSNILVS